MNERLLAAVEAAVSGEREHPLLPPVDYIPPEEAVVQRSPDDFAPPHIREAIKKASVPEYIVPQDDVPAAGVLTSVALAQEYERTAKAIEACGDELMKTIKSCEDLAARGRDALAHIQETAKLYRDDAILIFKRVEDVTKVTEEVRRQCDIMQQKLRGTNPT